MTGDRVVDDDVSIVNDEECVSNYLCLLQNKARFFFSPLWPGRGEEMG